MKLISAIAFWVCGSAAFAQGTFQDLDFEQATIVPFGTGVSAANAFPGWQVSIGGNLTAVVQYDALSVGAPSVSIFDDKTGFSPTEGSYTAYLQSAGNGVAGESISLNQTGTIPPGTESIWVDANQEQNSSFEVTVGGNNITMLSVRSFASYTVYEGDISAWSGKNTTLSITELPPSNPIFSPNLLQLDNIVFSSTEVTPEPNPLVLTALGGLLFGVYRRVQSRRK